MISSASFSSAPAMQSLLHSLNIRARLAAGPHARGSSGTSYGSRTSDSAAMPAARTGTVLVEFTVDTSGRVISAYAKSESPWPLLNNEAVRTVRAGNSHPAAS
jgi:TonB family protein